MSHNHGTKADRSQGAGGLDAVLPRQQLIDRFGPTLILEEFGKTDLDTIATKNASVLHHVAACVWNRIVQKGWHAVHPARFASHFQRSDPSLFQAIAKLLGVEVIRDIYYVRALKLKDKKPDLVAEIVVAWVYRNDLLLADVTFIDPTRPIPRAERQYELQSHKGLGLLPILLENMQRKAEELGCEQLILTAGTRDLADLFGRFGFVVEDSEMGRLAMEGGYGIPMERDVAAVRTGAQTGKRNSCK